MKSKDFKQGLMMGLALGNKLPVMPKLPTNIPVTQIIATPAELTLRPGDRGFIVFNIIPGNATIPKVECSSSDIEVVAVNRFQNEGLIFEYTAINSGTAQIKVEATDGYGATQTVIVNVLGAIIFETLSIKATQNYICDMFYKEHLIAFEYTPIEADGKNIRIDLHPNLSGNDTPYIVEDTMFDNIKKIKTTLESTNRLDYQSKAYQQGYDVKATDGSGLHIDNKYMSTSGLDESLYGNDYSDNLSKTLELRVGEYAHLGSIYRKQSILAPNNTTIEFTEGQDVISIDAQYVATALKVGTAKFTLKVAGVKTINYTVTVTDNYYVNIPAFDLVDEYGQEVRNSYTGYYIQAPVKYRVVPLSSCIIEKIVPEDAKECTVDGHWIIPKVAGGIVLRVYYKHLNSAGTEVTNNSREVYVFYSSDVYCGTVTSSYLKEGIAIWCGTYGNINNFNGININKIDVVYNANEFQLLGDIVLSSDYMNTLTFNSDGAKGERVTNTRPRIYHFKKLISSPATIKFVHHDFPDIFDSITI